MNSIVKNTLILTVITIISGGLLGAVYELTKEPIATAQEQAKQTAYKAVFKEAENFSEIQLPGKSIQEALASEGLEGEEITSAFKALSANGEDMGVVFNITTHEGYGGDINITVGIDRDGKVLGVEILDISETAGLGMKANKPEFLSQFADKRVSLFRYTKNGKSADNEIDAISGATITTNAMTNAVNAGLTGYSVLLAKGGALNE